MCRSAGRAHRGVGRAAWLLGLPPPRRPARVCVPRAHRTGSGSPAEPGLHLSLSKGPGENAPPFLDREPRERTSVPCAEECRCQGHADTGSPRAARQGQPHSGLPRPGACSGVVPSSEILLSLGQPLSADPLGTGGLAGGHAELRDIPPGLTTACAIKNPGGIARFRVLLIC